MFLLSLMAAAPSELAIGILPIVVGPASMPGDLSEDLRVRIRAVAEAQISRFSGLRALGVEEAFVTQRSGVERSILACGGDFSCQAGTMRKAGLNRALLVIWSALVDPPFVDVRLVDSAPERLISTSRSSVSGDLEAFLGQRILEALDRSGAPRYASLTVSVLPSEASVHVSSGSVTVPTIDGQTLRLGPGRHEIRAELEGFTPQSLFVDLMAGESRRTSLELSEVSSVWTSPWLWIGTGVFVVGTVGLMLATWPDQTCVCVQPATMECVCG